MLKVVAKNRLECEKIVLNDKALGLVEDLTIHFAGVIEHLLDQRKFRQREIDNGKLPDFLPETAPIRNSNWFAAPPPTGMLDRRVEITVPASNPKMMLNAANAEVKVYMADSEDAEAPTWENIIRGQQNLYDAIRRTLHFNGGDKTYKLNEKTAVLMFRPRGLHLQEKHCLSGSDLVLAMLFDVGLFLANNSQELINRGSGPYLYIPKLEGHIEARLINEILEYCESQLGLPKGVIKVTVLIETFISVFEMNEIIYELRDRICGLNCGRWDYLFSFIKKLSCHPEYVLPDRHLLTMNQHFLKSYSELLIQTCHRRGIHAMGGMAAQIPSKDEKINTDNIAKVKADKEREVLAGHDGTWVPHPWLAPLAKKVFDEHMPQPNQIHRLCADVSVSAKDLMTIPDGEVSEEGVRQNIRITLQYVEAWLRGVGCVPINNLMEDAATAEISRALLWSWRHHQVRLNNGKKLNAKFLEELISEEERQFQGGKFTEARSKLRSLVFSKQFPEFLTTELYDCIISIGNLEERNNG